MVEDEEVVGGAAGGAAGGAMLARVAAAAAEDDGWARAVSRLVLREAPGYKGRSAAAQQQLYEDFQMAVEENLERLLEAIKIEPRPSSSLSSASPPTLWSCLPARARSRCTSSRSTIVRSSRSSSPPRPPPPPTRSAASSPPPPPMARGRTR